MTEARVTPEDLERYALTSIAAMTAAVNGIGIKTMFAELSHEELVNVAMNLVGVGIGGCAFVAAVHGVSIAAVLQSKSAHAVEYVKAYRAAIAEHDALAALDPDTEPT